jgi:tryptophan synthase alpha chain
MRWIVGRIAETFARLHAAKRGALMPYLMVGYPEKDSLDVLAPALQAAGADLFEIGVPFRDSWRMARLSNVRQNKPCATA